MYNNHKVSVIIPVLNEEDSIKNVIRDIPSSVDEIVVVDNGSKDQTKIRAKEAGVIVADQPQRGYGSACLKGLSIVQDPDIVVILDGDYSDYPDQMTRLLDPIVNNQADFVIGSRVLGNYEKGSLTPQQYWGNVLATTLMRWFFRFRFTDMGPFRAIRYCDIKKMDMTDPNFGWNVEMQVKAIRQGLRILEVPVDYRNRIGQSKISGTVIGTIKAGSKIIATIFYYVFVRK